MKISTAELNYLLNLLPVLSTSYNNADRQHADNLRERMTKLLEKRQETKT